MYIDKENDHNFSLMELRAAESDNKPSANKLCNDTFGKCHQRHKLV